MKELNNTEYYLEKKKEIKNLTTMLKRKQLSIEQLDNDQKDMLIGYYNNNITKKKAELEKIKLEIIRKKGSIL